jgi:hypothetical protein
MLVVNKDVSHNEQLDPVKKYDRVVYHCETDDVWINIETPQSSS